MNHTNIIAEIGLNHNGSFSLAEESTHAAFECGADIVKFQNFKTEDFLKDKSITWMSDGVRKSLYDICKINEFKQNWFHRLMPISKKYGKKIISTPTSISTAKTLLKFNHSVVKNGSDYLTNLPLIDFLTKNFSHVILSVGMSYRKDIDEAVKISKKNKCFITLLHCSSVYPTPLEYSNLNKLDTLKKYSSSIGYSDHTNGWLACVIAVSKGAKYLEKHFTLDKKLSGPDHWFSSNPKEFKLLVKKVRLCEKSLGEKKLIPSKLEEKNMHQMRISLVFKKNKKKDSKINYNDFDLLKPKTKSLLYSDLKKIIGKKLKVNKQKGDSILIDEIS